MCHNYYMKKATALITGVAGQDGSYLAEFLVSKNYNVIGVTKPPLLEINLKKIKGNFELFIDDINDYRFLQHLIKKFRPDEIYNLAAQTSSTNSWENAPETMLTNCVAVITLFDVAREIAPKARIFQASSAEIFGDAKISPQNESTEYNPQTPYAISKLGSQQIAGIYRERYRQFISCGILFNHESERRSIDFITKKIACAVSHIKLATKEGIPKDRQGDPIIKNGKLELGNLDVIRDWGYAPDFVKAMWATLQDNSPNDYIIATGIGHTVKDICKIAFSHVGLDWENFVKVNPKLVRTSEISHRIGDPEKIKRKLEWSPTTPFEEWIKSMVDYELKLLYK